MIENVGPELHYQGEDGRGYVCDADGDRPYYSGTSNLYGISVDDPWAPEM